MTDAAWREQYPTERRNVDYKQLFLSLFTHVAACEAPEGSQVDEVLEKFQADFDQANQ